jgi:hypothetical protein
MANEDQHDDAITRIFLRKIRVHLQSRGGPPPAPGALLSDLISRAEATILLEAAKAEAIVSRREGS